MIPGTIRSAAAALGLLAAAVGVAAAAPGDALDDLLMDLQVIPMDRLAPKAFTLLTPAGKKLALADVKAPALLYFWATW